MTRKSTRLIGKLLALLILGAVLGLAVTLDPSQELSAWTAIVAASIAIAFIVLLYEGLWRLIDWPLRMLLGVNRLEQSHQLEPYDTAHVIASPWPPQPGIRHAVLLIAAYFGGMTLVWIVLGGIIGATATEDPTTMLDLLIPVLPGGLLSAWLLGLICVWLAVQWLRNRRGLDLRKVAAWSKPSLQNVTVYLAVGLLLGLVYIVVGLWLVPPDDSTSSGLVTTAAMESAAVRLVWGVGGVALAPFVEEYLFRGVLLGTVMQQRGVVAAIVLTTIPFVLLHLPETGSYWPALLGITSMAVVAAVARLRTGTLAAAIATHLGYNLMLVMVAMWAFR
ncbi:MAG: CPBP family intramembrane metalloprotease [Gemmatimonadota bacterium]|nr:MAG: CPBP family intramembrane metalloprotease [Gemmatimonadota bacterium]